MKNFDLSRAISGSFVKIIEGYKNNIFSPRTILDNIFNIFYVSQQLLNIFIF